MEIKIPKKSHPHLYRRHFTRKERILLSAIPENDVSSEVTLLRVTLDRSFELYAALSSTEYKLHLSYLRSTGNGVGMIAILLRTQNKINNPLTDLQDEIMGALDEIRKEMSIE